MRAHKMVARLCAAAALIAAAQGKAQVSLTGVDELGDAPGPQDEAQEGHAATRYAGVKPGGSETPPLKAKAGTTPPTITWPGFQMQAEGGSRVFVQLTAPVDVSAALVDGNVVVDFGEAKIEGTTNRLPLFTGFFNTPVKRIELVREKKRTRMVLSMRAPVEPRVSSEQSQSGFFFVYFDFPPGDYLEQPSAAVPGAPAPLAPALREESITQREPPSHLEGDLQSSSGRAQGGIRAEAGARMNAELPPGMARPKAGGEAKAHGKVKGEAKLGF